jgi:hypothetical protein
MFFSSSRCNCCAALPPIDNPHLNHQFLFPFVSVSDKNSFGLSLMSPDNKFHPLLCPGNAPRQRLALSSYPNGPDFLTFVLLDPPESPHPKESRDFTDWSLQPNATC